MPAPAHGRAALRLAPYLVLALASTFLLNGCQPPPSYAQLMKQGKKAADDGDFAPAETFFSDAIKAAGNSDAKVADATFELGKVYHRHLKAKMAIDTLQKALSLKERVQPNSVDCGRVLNQLGGISLENDDKATAESLFERALTDLGDDPEAIAVLNVLTTLHVEQGKYEQAEAECKRAIRMCEGSGASDMMSHLKYTLADILQKENKEDEANKVYASARKESVNGLEQDVKGEEEKNPF
jgi:tetratricopeptide (TPR) repeat protein